MQSVHQPPPEATFTSSAAVHPSQAGLSNRAAEASSSPGWEGASVSTPPAAGDHPEPVAAAEASATPGGEGGESRAAGAEAEADEGKESPFVCNICLNNPSQPVATVCGHVYCWGCLFKWLNLHRDEPTCPVCKAGIEMPGQDPSKAKIVPLYVNGQSEPDPRSKIPVDPSVPSRPQTERPPAQRFPTFQGWQAGMQPFGNNFNGHVSISAGLGLLPSLFGLTFVPAPVHPTEGPPRSDASASASQDEMAQQEFLSRVLFMIGTFIALCLIFFP